MVQLLVKVFALITSAVIVKECALNTGAVTCESEGMCTEYWCSYV